MGIKEENDTEQKTQQHEEAGVAEAETTVYNPTAPPDGGSNLPTATRLTTLKAILEEVSAPFQLWPREALRATLR